MLVVILGLQCTAVGKEKKDIIYLIVCYWFSCWLGDFNMLLPSLHAPLQSEQKPIIFDCLNNSHQCTISEIQLNPQ